MITSLLMSKIAPKVSAKRMCLLSIYMTAIVLLAFVGTDSLRNGNVFIIICIILRVLEGMSKAIYKFFIYSIMPLLFADKVSWVYTIQEVFTTGAEISGPSFGAILYEWGGYQMPFYVLGALVLSGALCFTFISNNALQQNSQNSGNFMAFLIDFGLILDSFMIIIANIIIGFNSVSLEPHVRQFK